MEEQEFKALLKKILNDNLQIRLDNEREYSGNYLVVQVLFEGEVICSDMLGTHNIQPD